MSDKQLAVLLSQMADRLSGIYYAINADMEHAGMTADARVFALRELNGMAGNIRVQVNQLSTG